MSRYLHLYAGIWLLGMFFAGWTAGAPVAVVCGCVGLAAFLGAVAARIGAQQPPAERHYRSR
jgi:hypothetical protein